MIGDSSDCSEDLGSNYRGTVNTTVDSRPCLRWDEQQYKDAVVYASFFPDATLIDAANFCRNPDSDTKGLWCWTDKYYWADNVWGYCDVPSCNGKGRLILVVV